MARKILIILAVILLVVGLGFLLFPPISNWIGRMNNEKLSREFDEKRDSIVDFLEDEDGNRADNAEDAQKKGITDAQGRKIDRSGKKSDRSFVFRADLDALHRDSLAYNHDLLNRQGTGEFVRYQQAVFDLRSYGLSDGMYAYLSIPKIDLRLPVYLGADDSTMSYGVGHLYGTSLPLDEKNTNCALAGHTDYIGRIFFDNIRTLEDGDEVTVSNYWENITYRVIDRRIVAEDEVNDLLIQKDRQLLTLITCIRGEEGFDRYLVICEKK